MFFLEALNCVVSIFAGIVGPFLIYTKVRISTNVEAAVDGVKTDTEQQDFYR